MLKSMVLFLLAGLAEIGGGYLMWIWLREGKPLWIGLLGGLILVFYGILPTLQPAVLDFGRVYAAYSSCCPYSGAGWWMARPQTPRAWWGLSLPWLALQ